MRIDSLSEYATVGYVEKRIRLRKTQFQMMQKLVSEKKKTVAVSLDSDMEHAPRQTVSGRALMPFNIYNITCACCALRESIPLLNLSESLSFKESVTIALTPRTK